MDRIPNTEVELDSMLNNANPLGMEVVDIIPFTTIRPKLDTLKKDWDKEERETEKRRRVRKIDVNVDDLRAAGKLKADETLIGVRVIDENIKKEQPIYINYLTQSDRLAVFDVISGTKPPEVKNLEDSFTRGMTYSGMIRNLYKTIDGAQAHGWDAVEVTYDENKPLKCGIEHIGHSDLLFSFKAQDAQADEVVARRFKVTESKLKSWVSKYGFDPKQVDNLFNKENENKIPEPVEIFKCFVRKNDIVYVGWYSLDSKTTDWLLKPSPLFLGRVRKEVRNEIKPVDMGGGVILQQQVPVEVTIDETETLFPIFVYIYSESEEKCITDQKGRIFFDRPWQDAQIALRTLVINGGIRASNVYGSPKNPSQTSGGSVKKLPITLEHGCFYSEPMEFWHTQYPDPAIMRAADSLDVRKAAETGQVASAVINRDDARKTSQEFKSAKEQEGKLALTPLMLFSGFMRDVLSFAWYIVKAQAMQNKIVLLPVADPETNQITNNYQILSLPFDIKPAGDTDVIRKNDRIARRVNLVPLVQGTPIWLEFLKDLIIDVLPEDAAKYIAIIDQAEANKDQMIMSLGEMLKGIVLDNTGNIKPEFQQYSVQLQQVFSQLPQTNESTSNNR